MTLARSEEPWLAPVILASAVGGHSVLADGLIFISTMKAQKKFNSDQTDSYQIPESSRLLLSRE